MILKLKNVKFSFRHRQQFIAICVKESVTKSGKRRKKSQFSLCSAMRKPLPKKPIVRHWPLGDVTRVITVMTSEISMRMMFGDICKFAIKLRYKDTAMPKAEA